MENGDVFEWVGKRGCLTEGVTRYFSKKLVGTLRYLNSRHILHRDIKPENILLDEHFEPLLLDFGLSMDARLKVHNFVGDIRFAAPEVVKHIEHTEKSETYSLGILMFYLQTGHHPFAHARVSDPNYRLLLERKPDLFW
jgi:serine/threonine protein kinase